MTDEEKWEEWRNANAEIQKTYGKSVHKHIIWYQGADRRKAFLDGLAEGKPKWHKVADGDYPPCEKDNCTINVLTNLGDIAYYNYTLECWVAEPSSAEIDPPIAWCEIPKYTDKE